MATGLRGRLSESHPRNEEARTNLAPQGKTGVTDIPLLAGGPDCGIRQLARNQSRYGQCFIRMDLAATSVVTAVTSGLGTRTADNSHIPA
jgi:hypothetical protein